MIYRLKNVFKQRQREQGYKLWIKNLLIPQGARIALTGPSGCGKSSTLDILGLSLEPDSAEKFDFDAISGAVAILPLWRGGRLDQLSRLRLENMGYVLQSGELLPFLTVGENISLTARLRGDSREEAAQVGKSLAAQLGIEHLWNAKPATLSVGERQRAAICRALAPHPPLILADEPTAALDPFHAKIVMKAFLDALARFGSTLILATHNAQWAREGGLTEAPFKMVEDETGATAILDYFPKGGA